MKKLQINKSRLTAEELQQYEALIAKARVEETDEKEEEENAASLLETPDEKGDFAEEDAAKEILTEEGNPGDEIDKETEETEKKNCQKSLSPEMGAAMARLEQLEKSMEMADISQVAKKYAALGEKEEELAKTLYQMKKSSPENYSAYLAVLDKSLALVEKSGIFAEIGKSTGGVCGAVGKIQAAATEMMKNDPSLNRTQAVAKAWEHHPELVAQYDGEYQG